MMPTPPTPTSSVATRPGTPASSPGKSRAASSPRKQLDIQARQELIALRKMCGKKASEIAKELDVSLSTVSHDLTEARRSGLFLAARDRIQSLVPKAIAALEAHLEAGDKDVALVVLEGLGIIGKHVQITVQPRVPVGGTFEDFRARILRSDPPADPPPHNGGGQLPAGWLPVIDATPAPEAGTPVGESGVARDVPAPANQPGDVPELQPREGVICDTQTTA